MANRRVLFSDIVHCGYEAVDLGLPSGLLWATCNIGARSPEETGLYFAWGEIQGYKKDEIGYYNGNNRYGQIKKYFNWSDYKWCNGSSSSITKYNTSDKNILDLEDDAAYMLIGKGWRMPSIRESMELYLNCTSIWTSVNGVNGRKFISNKNGQSVFFPAADYYDMGSVYRDGYTGIYWLSSYYTDNPEKSNIIGFDATGSVSPIAEHPRCIGCSIRGVLDL